MKKQDFREKLIEVRKERGLTQEDVAEMCNVNVRTIQRIESGSVTPRAFTIKVISEKLGIHYFDTSNHSLTVKEESSYRNETTAFGYLKDLFNLKSNVVRKISILSTPFFLAGFLSLFVSNSKTNAQTDKPNSSLNSYSFDLYRNVKVQNENMFLSPLSTYYALLAAYEGAKKETRHEFERVLYLKGSHSLNTDYLHHLANKPDSCASLKVANAVWFDEHIVIEGKYSKSLSDKYATAFEQTDFADRTAAVCDINHWVSEQTKHTINEIVSESDINDATNLVISNAVYFKGEWLMKFNKEKTASATFFSSPENQYKVDFMNMTESLKYYETEDYQFISKPYRHSNLSFCILLPKKLFAIEEIESQMNDAFLNEILDSLYYTPTALSMPKIKMEMAYELSNALKQSGLNTAFSGEADFSGITKDEPLQLSQVLHKTWLEVDEEQTEASAATAVISVRGAKPQGYKIFNADHPFVFFIIDNDTKSILFIGRYVKPLHSIKLDKANQMDHLNHRKQQEFEVGNSTKEPLYIVNDKVASKDVLKSIAPDEIASIDVIKNKDEIRKYTSKNYDGVIIITLKKDVNVSK